MRNHISVTAEAPTSRIFHDELINDEVFGALPHRLVYSARSSGLRLFPFPHFYATEVFPAAILEAIIKLWPAECQFKSIGDTKRVTAGRYRERLITSLDTLVETLDADSEQYLFWSRLHRSLASDELIAHLIEWLWPYIKAERTLPENVTLYSDVVLTDDKAGYKLGPHTDSPERLLTILFYVPQSNANPSAGTSIYVPKLPNYDAKVSAMHLDQQDFYAVYKAPFIQNASIGFLVGDRSFHGAEQIHNLSVPRRQIQYSIRLRPA
jgi:hypothetical protein